MDTGLSLDNVHNNIEILMKNEYLDIKYFQ